MDKGVLIWTGFFSRLGTFSVLLYFFLIDFTESGSQHALSTESNITVATLYL